MDENQNIEEEWTLDFHGITYNVNLCVHESLITLEIEDLKTWERWSQNFTAHNIEDLTQKVGNYKTFPNFIKMLVSALNNDNETVKIDIVTKHDLEIMKQRKLHETSSVSSKAMQSGLNNKDARRFVILTFVSQFDRVHYPLPLPFEETPNVTAMQRTIAKLRKQCEVLKEGHVTDEIGNDKDRDLRHTVTQLRQENQELKHRLRQAESRIHKQSNQLTHNTNGSATSSAAAITAAYANGISVNNAATTSSSQRVSESRIVAELKRRLVQSERELRSLKLSRGLPATSRSTGSGSGVPSYGSRDASPVGNRRATTPTYRGGSRSTTPTSTTRNTHGTTHSTNAGHYPNSPLREKGWNSNTTNLNSSRVFHPSDYLASSSRRPPSPRNTLTTTSSRPSSRSTTPNSYSRQQSQREYGHSSGYGTSNNNIRRPPTPPPRHIEYSPSGRRYTDREVYQQRAPHNNSGYSNSRSVLHNDHGRHNGRDRSTGRNGGSGYGSTSRYYREDGYDSNDSKGSHRSRGSNRSTHSVGSKQSVGSQHSQHSQNSKRSVGSNKSDKGRKTVKNSSSAGSSGNKKQSSYYITGGMDSEEENYSRKFSSKQETKRSQGANKNEKRHNTPSKRPPPHSTSALSKLQPPPTRSSDNHITNNATTTSKRHSSVSESILNSPNNRTKKSSSSGAVDKKHTISVRSSTESIEGVKSSNKSSKTQQQSATQSLPHKIPVHIPVSIANRMKELESGSEVDNDSLNGQDDGNDDDKPSNGKNVRTSTSQLHKQQTKHNSAGSSTKQQTSISTSKLAELLNSSIDSTSSTTEQLLNAAKTEKQDKLSKLARINNKMHMLNNTMGVKSVDSPSRKLKNKQSAAVRASYESVDSETSQSIPVTVRSVTNNKLNNSRSSTASTPNTTTNYTVDHSSPAVSLPTPFKSDDVDNINQRLSSLSSYLENARGNLNSVK